MMTTLQIVLAIVGVVLIGAIVLYNLIQERRFRKEAERMFSHRRDDIMLGESVRSGPEAEDFKPRISFGDDAPRQPEVERVVAEAEDEADLVFPDGSHEHAPAGALESQFDIPATAMTAEAAPPAAATESRDAETPVKAVPPAEPVPEPVTPEPVTTKVVEKPPRAPEKPVTPAMTAPAMHADGNESEPVFKPARGSGLDAETEYIARIRFATPCAANFGPMLTTLRRIGKPVRAFGKRLDGVWEPLTSHPRTSFDQVEIGLQLADRGGAVTHDQLDTFCRTLYGFAAEEGGAVSCPDKQDALQAAKALDILCMDVDVLIGLNVISSDTRPFTSEAIHKQAEDAKLVLESDGTYHARDPFGHTLFTLANQEEHPFPADGRGLTVHGVTLLFDVPRVADGLAVFDRMTRLGFDLAWRLEGRLVDDGGRAVTEDNLNRDRARLASFYGRMEARGIPAGGERALRLFV